MAKKNKEDTSEFEARRRGIVWFKNNISNAQAIEEDYDLNCLIGNDMGKIWNEVGGQDGMYSNFPITRIYRDKNLVRVYALDGSGGVAIIGERVPEKNFGYYRVVTLGEDDAYHFLNSRRIYEGYTGNKAGFIYLLSEALSLFNNIE